MQFIRKIIENEHYPRQLAALFDTETRMPLGPGQPATSKQPVLQAADLAALFAPQKIRNKDMAQACMSGLWLLHNFIDRSHQICQALDTREGSYWHAILHRREPDSWNSKYWFGRVREHAIYDQLCRSASALAAEKAGAAAKALRGLTRWDAAAFVDLCEKYRQTDSDDERLCEQVQMLEWHLLFAHCFRAAIGQ